MHRSVILDFFIYLLIMCFVCVGYSKIADVQAHCASLCAMLQAFTSAILLPEPLAQMYSLKYHVLPVPGMVFSLSSKG